MATQVLSTLSGKIVSSAINSTMVRATISAAASGIIGNVFYAIGNTSVIANNAVGTANCDLITTGQVRYINMQGLGNFIAVISENGAVKVVITECGTVFQSALNQNSTTFKNT